MDNLINERTVIGVDLDGVIFDFITDFTNFTNARFGRKNNPEDVNNWNWWECHNINLTKEEFIQGLEEYTRLRMWRDMPIYSDVKSNLCSLSLQGADILYITCRPRDARRSTVRSILSNGLPFDGIEFIEHTQKAKFAKFRGIDYVIEDKVETVIEYANQEINTYFRINNYNRSKIDFVYENIEGNEKYIKLVTNFRDCAEDIRNVLN
jgi:uncharacterized HAD superfamily protein